MGYLASDIKYNLLYFGAIVGIAAIIYAVFTRKSCMCEGFTSGPWTSSTGNGYTAGGDKYDYQFPDPTTVVIQGPGKIPSDGCIPSVGASIVLKAANLNASDVSPTNLAAFTAGNIADGTTITAVNTAHPRYGYGIVLTLSKPHTFPITPSGAHNVGLGYTFLFSFDKCESTTLSKVPVAMSKTPSPSPSSSSSSSSSMINYIFSLPARTY
jgi:hypothetical protein